MFIVLFINMKTDQKVRLFYINTRESYKCFTLPAGIAVINYSLGCELKLSSPSVIFNCSTGDVLLARRCEKEANKQFERKQVYRREARVKK